MAVILLLAAACAVLFFNMPAQKYKRQISLGEKYLNEMKYDEAAAAFTAAIKIGPTAEAYIGRAKAYAGNGDYEKSKEGVKILKATRQI